jgi:hypothetical protein
MFSSLRKFKSIIFAIISSLFLLSNASAGPFSVDCLGLNGVDCGGLIADIVTTKFTDKYPESDYQITLLVIQTKNGITASHASVAPKINAPSGFAPIGTRAWVVTKLSEDSSAVGLIKTKLESCRQAVISLMEHCEASPDCDVYNHNP